MTAKFGEWLPRETLPRDETVLVAVARRDGRPIVNGRMQNVYSAYINENGRICDCGTWLPDSGLDGQHFVTTAWMPLPPPPTESSDLELAGAGGMR